MATNIYLPARDKYGLLIYTLRMLGSHIYVVNSMALISAVQRQFRAVAFTPLAACAVKYAMGGSKTAIDIFEVDLTEDHGCLMSFDKAIRPALSPGPALDTLSLASIQNLAAFLNKLRRRGLSTINMFEWI